MVYLESIARVTFHIPDKGWAEMIRKGYEVDPMIFPQYGSTMKVIYQEVLMAAETTAEYIS
jgi:hypothetical protein